MLRLPLESNWTVRAVGDLREVPEAIRGRDIPATVPGCIHTDLLAAGLIPDPYLDRNEDLVQWIGRTDWRYRCAFEISEIQTRTGHFSDQLPPGTEQNQDPHPSPLPTTGEGEGILSHERVDLVCDGLDTIARLELNGQFLGQSANMHHPHRFDARGRSAMTRS